MNCPREDCHKSWDPEIDPRPPLCAKSSCPLRELSVEEAGEAPPPPRPVRLRVRGGGRTLIDAVVQPVQPAAPVSRKRNEDKGDSNPAPHKRQRREIGLSTGQMDAEKNRLCRVWKGKRKAGTLDPELEIASKGGHTCGATAEMDDGESLSAEFDSEECHAEMNLLQKIMTEGYQLDAIESIAIEKEPCPRCAVILNVLDLSDKVTYKKEGQKDYPTWRFPELPGTNWAVELDIHPTTTQVRQQETLKTYFQTNKWWQT